MALDEYVCIDFVGKIKSEMAPCVANAIHVHIHI
jgi:hypothetical protein